MHDVSLGLPSWVRRGIRNVWYDDYLTSFKREMGWIPGTKDASSIVSFYWLITFWFEWVWPLRRKHILVPPDFIDSNRKLTNWGAIYLHNEQHRKENWVKTWTEKKYLSPCAAYILLGMGDSENSVLNIDSIITRLLEGKGKLTS